MGCQSSYFNDTSELYFTEDQAPTVISSLNSSENGSYPSLGYKSKHFLYSSTKFLKIKSAVTMSLQSLDNFSEIQQVLDSFERLVYEKIEEIVHNCSEIEISLYESTKPAIVVVVQAEGIRKFEFLQEFIAKMQLLLKIKKKSPEEIQENFEFIAELAPLTVNFELTLGTDMDFMIGINKPIDRKSLSKFLQGSADRKIIIQWSSAETMPIPMCLQFSCLKSRRSCNFYLFDGEKLDNFSRAFAIFDCIGAPLQDSIKQPFLSAKSEEAFCKVVLEEESITEVGVEISQVPYEEYLNVAKILQVEAKTSYSRGLEKLVLQLDRKGMSLLKHTDV